MVVSFGSVVASARKAKLMSQKELAQMLTSDDGTAVSPRYLNEIEHDRISPTSCLIIKQLANTLGLDETELRYLVTL